MGLSRRRHGFGLCTLFCDYVQGPRYRAILEKKKTKCNRQACLVRGKGRKPSEWWAMDVVEAWSAGASGTAKLGKGQGAGDGRLAIGPAVVWVFKT